MIKQFQFRLTALCTLITSLILVIFTVICLSIFETEIRTQETDTFQTNLDTVYQNLQFQSSIPHQWLRQAEHNYQFFLRITDNGVPLFFQSLSQNEPAELLLNQAEEIAFSKYGINTKLSSTSRALPEHKEFTMKEEHRNYYYASAALLPMPGGTLGVTILHPLTQMNHRIEKQRLIFGLADLTAICLFCIFFWLFIGRMMCPIRENREKQMQFVASASHELRSPLAVILSNVDAVKCGSMNADTQFLDTIGSEGRRMSHLISDMLQLANADNHSWSMHPTNVEMDTLLLQTFESFEPIARSKNLHWEISLPNEAIPLCHCDEERIRQLLSILIDNAFCYTPAGKTVRLSLKAASGTLQIAIADNGPGIPDSLKKSVFERFYCVDSSHKNKAHFGLGLCIAQEIVKLHRGKLLLTDTPGGGATFTAVLPINSSK